ncbi:MAG: amidohydrolase family protein, partial [Hyphomicrobiales bacterium]|nr:amidohydrolase family protein [Hyphomicrobiales bacterium]
MNETCDVAFIGGTVVNQDGTGPRDIAVRDGRITAIGSIDPATAGEAVDCSGLHILPGVIDTQVHFREPGGEHKEDLESGSLAAVMGGVTAVFEMPNTNPLTTSAEALADKLERASGRMHCDFAFFVGGTHGNVDDIPELERLPGAAGIKIFMGSSTGDLLVADDAGLAKILGRTRRRVSIHAEDEPRLIERTGERSAGDPASHPVWRDETAALRATERLVRIARQTGARVHLLHVSTAEEIAFISDYKDNVTVELTPQHLSFHAEHYDDLGSRLQMNPPIRGVRHQE